MNSLAYSPRLIIASADLLKALGHTGLDRFILGLGLPKRTIGHGRSLSTRTTSLAKYVTYNGLILTRDRITLQWAIIRRAKELWADGNNPHLHLGEREKFAAAYAAEGPFHPLPEDMIETKGWADAIPRPGEKQPEIVQVKIAFMGISVDLIALWQRYAPVVRKWWRDRWRARSRRS